MWRRPLLSHPHCCQGWWEGAGWAQEAARPMEEARRTDQGEDEVELRTTQSALWELICSGAGSFLSSYYPENKPLPSVFLS